MLKGVCTNQILEKSIFSKLDMCCPELDENQFYLKMPCYVQWSHMQKRILQIFNKLTTSVSCKAFFFARLSTLVKGVWKVFPYTSLRYIFLPTLPEAW